MRDQNPFPALITIEGYQRISGTCSDYDDVRVETGNLVRHIDIINIPSLADLRFSLIYNSVETINSTVGQKWRHNALITLVIDSLSAPTSAAYTDETGRVFNFAFDSMSMTWVPADSNLFSPITLTVSSGVYYISYFPDGTVFQFSVAVSGATSPTFLPSSGTDSNGNVTSYHYNSDGNVDKISEAAGRFIQIGYDANKRVNLLTDPKGLQTSITYDGSGNLATITSPEGCVLTYLYDTVAGPAHSLKRTNALGKTYTYTFDSTYRVLTVQDAETTPNQISYSYGTVNEYTADPTTEIPDYRTFAQTTLLDARGQTWYFRFDTAGNLWRVIDPLGHYKRLFWSPQNRLLYLSEGYGRIFDPATHSPLQEGPKDNLNNRAIRNVYDPLGNLLYEGDSNGIVNQYEYDTSNRMTASILGRVNFAVQGDWVGKFGQDGYLLCAFNDATSDVSQWPAYLGTLGAGESDGSNAYSLVNFNSSRGYHLMDPRAPVVEHPGSPPTPGYTRGVGYWTAQSGGNSFTFRLPLTQNKKFNLSLYTHSADQYYNILHSGDGIEDGSTGNPTAEGIYRLLYSEQFGRDVEILVSDRHPVTGALRQQRTRVTNNAGGAWVTFSVNGNTGDVIRVKVRARGNSVDPVLSAIAFDPFVNRRTEMSYDGHGNLLQVLDPLLNKTQYSYNGDGTLATMTDAKLRVTHFYYDDTPKNLTRIVDALTGTTTLVYDANSNVLSVQDPDLRTYSMVYDGKNRVVKSTDPLGYSTSVQYDAAGNLTKVSDPLARTIQLAYTPDQRILTITDALGQNTAFTYDPAGYALTITDPNTNVVHFAYDARGRMSTLTQPDTQVVNYVFNAIDRLVAITPPNGTQSSVANINLTGAKNRLPNPSMEQENPFDTSSQNRARYWQNSAGANVARSTTQPPHSGTYTLPTGDNSSWNQTNLTAYAGGRYLANYWVSKATAGTSTSWLVATTRGARPRSVDDVSTVNTLTGSNTALTGSSTAWVQGQALIVDIPGDTQASSIHPPLAELRLNATSSSSTTYLDDASLYLLSTCMEYDGENLREVGTPDGARSRMEYDQLGRMFLMTDPVGRTVTLTFDALDRVLSASDSLGQTVSFVYDEVGNLTSFKDARSKITQYAYDDLDRLHIITYPDTTTEVFVYTAAGDLYTYTDNQSRTRTFTYDNAHRPTQITFSDSSIIKLGFDPVGRVTSVQERNGDLQALSYDLLDRLVAASFTPASTSPQWALSSTYDANGNRTGLLGNAPVYGSGIYGTSRYLTGASSIWSVPGGGFDSMNRLLQWNDANSLNTALGYDIEGRRNQITFPNSTLTQAVYDIVGKLLQLKTTKSGTDILHFNYGYNQAGDRLAVQTSQDSFDYLLDGSGRLIEESINRFAERNLQSFQRGVLNQCMLGSNSVQLLSFSDPFSSAQLNTDRWQVLLGQSGATETQEIRCYGLEVRQNNGLHFVFPRGGTNRVAYTDPASSDGLGYTTGAQGINALLTHNLPLSGDFDIVLDFTDWRAITNSEVDLQLVIWPKTNRVYDGNQVITVQRMNFGANPQYQYRNTSSPFGPNSYATGVDHGSLRVARSGSTLTVYHTDDTGAWVANNPTVTGYAIGDLYLAVQYYSGHGVGSVRALNLRPFSSSAIYPTSGGTYTSSIYDAGQSVTWSKLTFSGTTPTNTSLKFQIATSNSPSGPWNYVGPGGTSATYFTATGAIAASTTGRYARYIAYLGTTDGLNTPSFTDVALAFTGANTSTQLSYGYDAAGNITSKTTVTDSATTTDVRTPNDLNQITTQVVGGVTYTYTWNNDGTLASKAGGGNTWAYTWDSVDGQRLLNMKLNTVLQVAFTYDSMGRMLTRTPYTSGVAGTATKFVWDGWTCIQEIAPAGTYRYYAPQGELQTFDYTPTSGSTSTYTVMADALGSVRAIANSTGTIVGRYDTDAWGANLASTSDVSFGFAYRYVGALGVRWDATLGMYYMRKRWYDPGLQRFVSRDPIGYDAEYGLYLYAQNQPTQTIDPEGLKPIQVYKEGADGIYRLTKLGLRDVSAILKSGFGNFWLQGKNFSARMKAALSAGQAAWGKNNVVVHPPHPNSAGLGGTRWHVQPGNRIKCPTRTGTGSGHIFFSFLGALAVIGNINDAMRAMQGEDITPQPLILQDPSSPRYFMFTEIPGFGIIFIINEPYYNKSDLWS